MSLFCLQASVSAPTPYVRPALRALGSTSNRLKLVQSRHPCVELQDTVSFIPNNAALEKENHDFIIVTGMINQFFFLLELVHSVFWKALSAILRGVRKCCKGGQFPGRRITATGAK